MTTTTSNRHISRLLDLPGELRTQIYEEALYHDRRNGHCAVITLLRTCRQVREEAHGLLFENNTFFFSVSTTPLGTWELDASQGYNGKEIERFTASGDLEARIQGKHMIANTSPIALEDIYDIFPQALLKSPVVKLELEVTEYFEASQFVFALGCFLSNPGANTTRLSINVDIKQDSGGSFRRLDSLWYGLTKLPSKVNFSVSGDLKRFAGYQAVNVRYLKDGHPHPNRSPAAAFNTIAEYKRIVGLAQSLINQRRKDFESLKARTCLRRNCEAGKRATSMDTTFLQMVYLLRPLNEMMQGYNVNWGKGAINRYEDSSMLNALNTIEEWVNLTKGGSKSLKEMTTWVEELKQRPVVRTELDEWDAAVERETADFIKRLRNEGPQEWLYGL